MRIAFDSQSFCRQQYGGITRYFVRLVENLLKKEMEVKVFAPTYQNSHLKELSSTAVSGRYFKKFPSNTARFFINYNRVMAKPLMRSWGADVSHETYFSRFQSAPIGTPTVLTVYDMVHELFPEKFSKWDFTSKLKRIAVDRANHIICISENTRYDLIRLFDVPEEKTSVVHLGVDTQFPYSDCNRETSIKESRPYLLYVGARGGYKNFINVLRALAVNSRIKAEFDLIAFGGGKFSSNERKIIDELGFGVNQVRQRGGNDVELSKLYKGAAAFVYPSIYEGFGIPPLEAMVHGCPVISSNTSSMPEVIGNAAEYFNPTHPEEISFAIEAVVYSDERKRVLIDNGLKRSSIFSWSQCAEDTIKIYQALKGR